MAHRRIRLEDGEWDVWDVRPELRMQRLGNELERGWLCFQSGPERRRLNPIPENWDQLDERGVQDLFRKAKPVGPTRANLTDTNHSIHMTPGTSDD